MHRCNLTKEEWVDEWPSIRYACNKYARTRESNEKIKDERRLKKQRRRLLENEDSDDYEDEIDDYRPIKKRHKW